MRKAQLTETFNCVQREDDVGRCKSKPGKEHKQEWENKKQTTELVESEFTSNIPLKRSQNEPWKIVQPDTIGNGVVDKS